MLVLWINPLSSYDLDNVIFAITHIWHYAAGFETTHYSIKWGSYLVFSFLKGVEVKVQEKVIYSYIRKT